MRTQRPLMSGLLGTTAIVTFGGMVCFITNPNDAIFANLAWLQFRSRLFRQDEERLDHTRFVLKRRLDEQVKILRSTNVTGLDHGKSANDHEPGAKAIEFAAEVGDVL